MSEKKKWTRKCKLWAARNRSAFDNATNLFIKRPLKKDLPAFNDAAFFWQGEWIGDSGEAMHKCLYALQESTGDHYGLEPGESKKIKFTMISEEA